MPVKHAYRTSCNNIQNASVVLLQRIWMNLVFIAACQVQPLLHYTDNRKETKMILREKHEHSLGLSGTSQT